MKLNFISDLQTNREKCLIHFRRMNKDRFPGLPLRYKPKG